MARHGRWNRRSAESLDLVDGQRTPTMAYGVRYLISYLSRFMTLHPGELIAAGTPVGVGLEQKPPLFLKRGTLWN